MILCKVLHAVTSQQKESCLSGKKLFVCESSDGKNRQKLVAVDLVGAGSGAEVLVSKRYASIGDDYIDCYIVAILDQSSEKA